MEFDPNSVYCIDIDNTICDSSGEFARWREKCRSMGCAHFLLDGDHFCAIRDTSVCIYQPKFRDAGIFGVEALLELPPISEARHVLKGFKRAYYISGRPESQRQVTLTWLEKNRFPMFRLYLRSDQDLRSTVTGKAEVLYTIKQVYRKDGEPWVWIDDDERARPFAKQMDIGFLKAPECFF